MKLTVLLGSSKKYASFCVYIYTVFFILCIRKCCKNVRLEFRAPSPKTLRAFWKKLNSSEVLVLGSSSACRVVWEAVSLKPSSLLTLALLSAWLPCPAESAAYWQICSFLGKQFGYHLFEIFAISAILISYWWDSYQQLYQYFSELIKDLYGKHQGTFL